MIIREARPDEYEVVGELTAAAYQALDDMAEDMGRYGDELRDVAGRAANDGWAILVAELDDVLVGHVAYVTNYGAEMQAHSAEGQPAFEAAGFRMLATTPEAQGKGVGRALTQHCIDRARSEGHHTLALHTTDLMPTAMAMYERMGFVRWPDHDYQIGRRNPVKVYAFRFDLS